MTAEQVMVTGSAQQEAWRRGTLPDLEQVARGIWSIPVPMPGHPMRYVVCYLIESSAGPVLLDPGWPTDVSWEALVAGIAGAGWSVSDVHGVLISHAHSDHHGLAFRVREASGAWVGMHSKDAELLQTYRDGEAAADRNGRFLHDCGVPEPERDALLVNPAFHAAIGALTPDRLIEDGAAGLVPGRDVEARWTPGHTPGHLCFLDRKAEVVFTGDHLLPRITSHVGTYDLRGPDVLGDYLQSLRMMATWVDPLDAEVLPAHEYRFRGVEARVTALEAHHHEREAEIVQRLVELGGGTVWEVAAGIHWSRTWDQTAGDRRRMALAETLAHLRQLETRGQVTLRHSTPPIWTARGARASVVCRGER
jgi:glyoxylase-like metal-dependent hydrolase (beta-lactamase superfamily II)